MHKFAIIILFGCLLLSSVVLAAWGTLEDFTSYTEADPGTTITVAENTITFTNFNTRNTNSYVAGDKGAAYFNGDFSHRMKINISASATTSYVMFWALTNDANDLQTIDNAGGEGADYLAAGVYDNGATSYIRFRICEDGEVFETGLTYAVSLATDYYITIERVDAAGANSTGLLTIRVYTTNYYGESGAVEVHNVRMDCGAGEQNDFRYVHGLISIDTNTNVNASGTVSNLDIGGPVSPPAGGGATMYMGNF